MRTDGIDERLGARIRDLRAERGLTLEALAALADVSRAMLSRVERGESSPTAQLLNRICGGLGVTLSALFAAADRAGPLARHEEQPVWRDPATGYLRRNVSPADTGSAVDIVEITFPQGESVTFRNARSAGADQHVWVLDGTMEVGTGAARHRLDAGDCLFMPLDQPTLFHNPTDRPARYVVVLSRLGSRA